MIHVARHRQSIFPLHRIRIRTPYPYPSAINPKPLIQTLNHKTYMYSVTRARHTPFFAAVLLRETRAEWNIPNSARSSSRNGRTQLSRISNLLVNAPPPACSPSPACTVARYPPSTAASYPSPHLNPNTRSTKGKMATAMSPQITHSRSSSSIRSRFHRVPAALLLVALLIAAAFSGAAAAEDAHEEHAENDHAVVDAHGDEHSEEEPPIEHLYEAGAYTRTRSLFSST